MNTSTAAERRIRYDDTFKAEAIRLWKTSHRSARVVAKELGISPATLYSWGRESRPTGEMVPSHLIKEMEEELCRLREERGQLRQQCAILKRMLSIFFELPDGKSRQETRRLRPAG
jgi:transposase-like protein